MTLPQQFPYNLRPKLLALSFGVVAAAIALFYFEGGPVQHRRLLWLGAVLGIFYSLLAARTFLFRRALLLTETELVLPTGVGRLRSRYIPYSNIRRVWQIQIVRMTILRLETDLGNFEIASGMLADFQTYIAIANFLHFHAESNAASRTILPSGSSQIYLGPKMGKINVAAYGMALGTLGQALMLARRPGAYPSWAMFLLLLGPWILVHLISFCKVPPCGPKRFAQILSISMWWYSFDTLCCELLWVFAPTSTSRLSVAVFAHAFAYGGATSFIVLIRAVRAARTFAENRPETA
jgi:hypothetical protein